MGRLDYNIDYKGFIVFLIVGICFFISGYITADDGKIIYNLQYKLLTRPIRQDFNETWCIDTKTLFEASYCLKNNLMGYYKYKVRIGENNTYNITDILQNGGDCTEYSYFYKTMLERLGYKTENIIMYPKDNDYFGHMFVLAYDNNVNEYCILDQMNVECYDIS